MSIRKLRLEVHQANMRLAQSGLIVLTWGNVSGIDRQRGLVAIKPSGVPYSRLRPEHIVVVDMDGKKVAGDLRPSSDTPTHIELYRNFQGIGGITHTHSIYATAFAQAEMEIPCLGTTHADLFFGPVPVTRRLAAGEVEGDYELQTGKVIVERFRKLDPSAFPGVLAARHGPFTWGGSAMESVEAGIALETVAAMAFATLSLRKNLRPVPDYLLRRHYLRKHGPNATYGQKRAE